MRTSREIAPINGTRMRVTRLDGCGRPVYGDDAVVITEGFITVGFTANTTDTDEINVQNANNKTIAYQPGKTDLSGYGLEFSFGVIQPEAYSILTGQDVYFDADGNPIGLEIDTKVDLTGQAFALEIWTGAAGGDACADDEAEGSYGYFLVPYAQGGVLGDFSVAAGAISMTLTGANTRDNNSWGKGPYNDVMLNNPVGGGAKVAGPLVKALKKTSPLLIIETSVEPPEALSGSRPLLRPTNPGITSVAAAVTGNTATISVSPDAETGVWYEFGDDTWDYVDAPGDVVHVYDQPGTYTLMASTAGKWVSHTVTIAA